MRAARYKYLPILKRKIWDYYDWLDPPQPLILAPVEPALSVSVTLWEWLTHIRWAIFWTLHLSAFSLVTIHCLKHRREATSALLWIFVAWSFPIVGPLLFLGFGVNRVPSKGWRKQRSDQELLTERIVREDAAMPLAYWRAVHRARAAEPADTFARELNCSMNAILPDYPLLEGNKIEPLVTGEEAFPRMLAAVEAATHHIHVQTFIISNDRIGRMFLDALAQKARSGVTVRFLFDRFGSTRAWVSGLIDNYLKLPNFKVVGWTQANPIKRQFQLNLRNHRKLLIVDGNLAFIGGINLAENNVWRDALPPDRDYHFAVTGPIVQELQYTFFRDWYFMTDESPDVLLTEAHFPQVSPTGTSLIRVVNGGPTAAEVEVMTDVFFAAITAARRQLLAVTPYLVPTPDLLRAFRSAALRGVDVRLLVPLKNNHPYAGMAGRAYYDDLLSASVRIFERPPPFLHAKALIVDDTLTIVGTANLDVRSLRLNYETNLAVFDPAFANRMKQIVLEEMAAARELDLVIWRARPTIKKLAENFCSLLTPVL